MNNGQEDWSITSFAFHSHFVSFDVCCLATILNVVPKVYTTQHFCNTIPLSLHVSQGPWKCVKLAAGLLWTHTSLIPVLSEPILLIFLSHLFLLKWQESGSVMFLICLKYIYGLYGLYWGRQSVPLVSVSWDISCKRFESINNIQARCILSIIIHSEMFFNQIYLYLNAFEIYCSTSEVRCY